MKIHKLFNSLLLGLVLCSPAMAQTTWTGGNPSSNEWNQGDNWNAAWPNGSTTDVVIDLPPTHSSPYTVALNDSLIINPDLYIELNSLFVGPEASLEIADSLDFTGNSSVTIVNEGVIALHDQNGPHELWLTRTILNSGDISANWVQQGPLDLWVKREGATLTGGGSISLLGNGNSGLSAPAGNPWLMVADQTIRGYGGLGRNSLGIQIGNNGVIDASFSGSTLTFDVSDSGTINDGVMRASNGGTLKINNSDITNNNVIEALEGSLVELYDTNIEGGQLQGSGNFLVQSLSSFTDLATSGTVTTNNAVDLVGIGTITNTGNIVINYSSGGNIGSLEVTPAGLTLEGGGTVRLSGNLGGYITGATDARLTIGNQIIAGYGQLGNNELQIINSADGLILADNGNLTIDTGVLGAVNDGLMQATEAGTLIFQDSNIDNTNGVIEALADSEVKFNSGSEITGGQLQGDGTFIVAGRTTFTDLSNSSAIFASNVQDIVGIGTLNNTGAITIDYSTGGDPGSLEVTEAGLTLTGGGSVRLAGNFGGFVTGATDALLTIEDQTIQGYGQIGLNQLQMINSANGLILANNPNGGDLTVNAGNLGAVNEGIFRAADGGDLKISDTQLDNTNGLIEAQAGSRVILEGANIKGGQLLGDGDGHVFVNTDSLLEDVEIGCSLVGANTIDVEVRGNIVNSGDIFINYSTGGNPGLLEVKSPGATFTGGGTIQLVGNFGGFIDGDVGAELRLTDQTIIGRREIGLNHLNIVLEPDATITTSGTLTIDPFGSDDWTTQGTIRAQDGDIINIDNPIINDGNFEVVDTSGSSIVCRAGSMIHTANSRLSGVGKIQSFGSMNVDGTVSPGSSAGTLRLQSGTGTTLGATAETEIELFSNADYDVLAITGNLNLGGSLHITLMDEFVPDNADVFTIVTGGNQQGTFANAAGSIVTTADGLGCFTIVYSPTSVTLSNFVPLAALDSVTPTRGTYVSGDIGSLTGSNNGDYVLQRNTADTQSRTEFEVNSTSPVAVPSTMMVRLEGAVFARSQVTQTIELFNYASGNWEVVDTRGASRFVDSVAEVEVTGDLSRFVETGTLNMVARIRFVSASARQKFSSNTDQFVWCVE